MGPFPMEEMMGMGGAVVMLQWSLDKDIHNKTLQFEMIKKLCAAVSNIFHASVKGQGAMTMAKDTKKLMVTTCPTCSDYFECFICGMHKRMGNIVRPDHAISIPLMLGLLAMVEMDWSLAPASKKLTLALEGTFYTLAYALALWGEEVPLVELHGLFSHWDSGLNHERPHVVVSLLSCFKNEFGVSYHLMPVVVETPTGFHPKKWVERVLDGYQAQGILRGYVFHNHDNTKLKPSMIEAKFHLHLERIKQHPPDLISERTDVTK